MSIQNTGLGWYADENWLKESAGIIGTITVGEGRSFLKLSPGTTKTWVGSVSPGGTSWYLANEGNVDIYVAFFTSNQATPPQTTIWWNGPMVFSHGIPIVRQYRDDGDSGTTNLRNKGDGIYGASILSMYYRENWQPVLQTASVPTGVPVYTTGTAEDIFAEALNDFKNMATSQDFYKLNSGYAVSGFVRYKNAGGISQITPFLISSDSSYCLISEDGTSEVSGSIHSVHARDNMVFHMTTVNTGIDTGTVTGGGYFDLTNLGNMTNEYLFNRIALATHLGVGTYTGDNPYEEMGTTETGGGGGTMEIISTPVPLPSLPSPAMTDAGFFTVFVPTEENIRAFARWLWTTNAADERTWKRAVVTPMDLILGLNVFPFPISADGNGGIVLGGVATGITAPYTDTQFHRLDFGTVNIEEVWGAYLDYNPYTSIEIVLPYIGTRQLDVDEIMGKTIHLIYNIDIITGACVASISVPDYSSPTEETTLYQFLGNCALQIPVTSLQMVNIIRNATALVTSIGTFAATAGVSGAHQSPASIRHDNTAHMAAGGGILASAASLVATKRQGERSGSVSSSAGFLSVQKPYLIIKRPNQAMPENQQHYTGYPSFITENMGDLEGYTEVEAIHLENIPCTDKELDEIEAALKNGVIF